MARLWVLCIPIKLAPKKEKPEKEPKKEKADKPAKKEKAKKEKKKPNGEKKKKADVLSLKKHAAELKENGVFAAAAWLKEIAGLLLTAFSRILDAITVTKLYANAEIAGEDSAKTALTYGKLCATVFPALGVVESKLKVKKQQVRLVPAFCLEKTQFSFDVAVSVSLWRIVVAALRLLVGYLKMPSVGELKQQQSETC